MGGFMQKHTTPAQRGRVVLYAVSFLIIGIAVGIGILVQRLSDSNGILGTSILNWAVLIGVAILAWIPAIILQIIVSNCIKYAFSIVNETNRFRISLIVDTIRPRIRFLIWSAALFGVWRGVFLWNPFPLEVTEESVDANGNTVEIIRNEGDLSDNLVGNSFIIVMVFSSVVGIILEVLLVKNVKLAKRTTNFAKPVRDCLKIAEAIEELSKDIDADALRRPDLHFLGKNDVTLAQNVTAARVLQNFFKRFVQSKKEKRSSGMDRMDSIIEVPDETVTDATARGIGGGIPNKKKKKDDVSLPEDEDDSSQIAPIVDSDVTPELLTDFEYFKSHYITSCRKEFSLKSPAHARRLGLGLFIRFSEPNNGVFKRSSAPSMENLDAASTQSDTKRRSRLLGRLTPSGLKQAAKGNKGTLNGSDKHVAPNSIADTADSIETTSRGASLRDRSNLDEIVRTETLMSFFPDDPQAAKLVQQTFDPSAIEYITQDQMVERMKELYKTRKNLNRSVSDLDSALVAVESFLVLTTYILSFLFLLVIFSQGEFASFTVTISTSIFALSFVFAENAKNVFNSFIFLFVRHPFDVGDRIYRETMDSNPMFVRRLQLLNTTFQVWSGEIVTIPNHVLANETIFNIARSGPMAQSLTLQCNTDTPSEKLVQMRESFLDWCEAHSTDFLLENCSMVLVGQSSYAIDVAFFLGYTSNWQHGEHMRRRQMAIFAIKRLWNELGIRFDGTPNQVMMSEKFPDSNKSSGRNSQQPDTSSTFQAINPWEV